MTTVTMPAGLLAAYSRSGVPTYCPDCWEQIDAYDDHTDGIWAACPCSAGYVGTSLTVLTHSDHAPTAWQLA
jgi:hypothetical protein